MLPGKLKEITLQSIMKDKALLGTMNDFMLSGRIIRMSSQKE